MLTNRRLPARLSMVSLDLPVRSACETIVTLYQRAPERFHVLIDVAASQWQPRDRYSLPNRPNADHAPDRRTSSPALESQSCLLWLELSPTRAIFTSQSNAGLSYRHTWESGTYGISRYWLNPDAASPSAHPGDRPANRPTNHHQFSQTTRQDANPEARPGTNPSASHSAHHNTSRMRLRNFTRSLELTGQEHPEHFRLTYELWSQQLKLGSYVLALDIHG